MLIHIWMLTYVFREIFFLSVCLIWKKKKKKKKFFNFFLFLIIILKFIFFLFKTIKN